MRLISEDARYKGYKPQDMFFLVQQDRVTEQDFVDWYIACQVEATHWGVELERKTNKDIA